MNKKLLTITLCIMLTVAVSATALAGIMYGDVNKDGKVTNVDLILLSRHIAGIQVENIDLAAADVNGDGKVTNVDLIIFRRYIAGIIDELDPQNKVFTKWVKPVVYDMNKPLDITNMRDLVSINYSTWFNPIVERPIYNITEILAGKQQWGPVHAFHYWAKPQAGYYRSDDKKVIRKHMNQLSAAGVDFIVIDNTNVSMDWKNSDYWNKMVTQPVTALLETIIEMRSEGKITPYVVFWTRNADGAQAVNATYEEFYKSGKYNNAFVYWDGKPFGLITHPIKGNEAKNFTVRHMWGLQAQLAVEEWTFLQKYPQNVSKAKDGTNEQTVVCAALQLSYITNPDAIGRKGGYTFWQQWKTAFESRPKVINITWWNEWAAQRFVDDQGNSRFVDNYNMELSRDIEPVEGGHGNLYYYWMNEYIRAYKLKEPLPKLVNVNDPYYPKDAE